MDDNTREIPLTQSGLAAIVDVEDYDLLKGYTWTAHKGRYTWYAERTELIIDENGLPKKIHVKMHRQILGLVTGSRLTLVDHASGNGLDNRRANLRKATYAENAFNRKTRDSARPYKGVHRRQSGRWSARITANGNDHALGMWPTAGLAVLARDSAALYFHGEFAKLAGSTQTIIPKSPATLQRESRLIDKILTGGSHYRHIFKRGEKWRCAIHGNFNKLKCERYKKLGCGTWLSEYGAAIAADSALNFLGDANCFRDSSRLRNFPCIVVEPHSPEELTRMARQGVSIKWEPNG